MKKVILWAGALALFSCGEIRDFFAGKELVTPVVPALRFQQSSLPPNPTYRDNAAISFQNDGHHQYLFRLNGGPWSDKIAIQDPIALKDLAPGEYLLEAQGVLPDGRTQGSPSQFAWTVLELLPLGILSFDPLSLPPALGSESALGVTVLPGNFSAFRYSLGDGWSSDLPLDYVITESLSDGPYTLSVLGVMVDGREQDVPTKYSFTVDTTPPEGTFNISGGVSVSASPGVTLVNEITGASQMRFSLDQVEWSQWEDWKKLKAFYLREEQQGQQTVYAQFQDDAGNQFLTSDTVILDTLPPEGSFVINDDAPYTNKSLVHLYADLNEGFSMRFKLKEGRWSSWMNYDPRATFELDPEIQGIQTIQAQYRDRAGNSLLIEDDILYDSLSPEGTFSINKGGDGTTLREVSLEITVHGAREMRFANQGESWPPWENYATSKGFTLSPGDPGIRSVLGQFRDAAGNLTSLSDSIEYSLPLP
jgi:hypothetical protein